MGESILVQLSTLDKEIHYKADAIYYQSPFITNVMPVLDTDNYCNLCTLIYILRRHSTCSNHRKEEVQAHDYAEELGAGSLEDDGRESDSNEHTYKR